MPRVAPAILAVLLPSVFLAACSDGTEPAAPPPEHSEAAPTPDAAAPASSGDSPDLGSAEPVDDPGPVEIRQGSPEAAGEQAAADLAAALGTDVSAVTELPPVDPDVLADATAVRLSVLCAEITWALRNDADVAALDGLLGEDLADGSLSPETVRELRTLLSALQLRGDVAVLSAPTVLVQSGSAAVIEIGQAAGPGRSRLTLDLEPHVRPGAAGAEPTTVDLRWAFRYDETAGRVQRLAAALGIRLGPHAAEAGADAVPTGATVLTIREITGDAHPRVLLVLIEPTILDSELSK